MKLRVQLVIVCLLLTVAWKYTIGKPSDIRRRPCPTESSLQNKDARVFNAVPVATRSRFIERLRLLIEYRRTKQWDKFSSLLSSHSTRGRSKEQIVKDYLRYPGVAGSNRILIKFVPKATSFQSDAGGKWIVSGCTKLSGVGVPIDAFVVGWQENGDWYFSDVDTFLPRDTNFHTCSYKSSHTFRNGKHKGKAIKK